MPHDAEETFISEPIAPAPGSSDVRAMARGEPGLPARFTWRETTYCVTDAIKTWKTSSREGGRGKLYLRRHWYTVQTDQGPTMTLYCERQARSRKRPKSRWWIYTLEGRPRPHAGERAPGDSGADE